MKTYTYNVRGFEQGGFCVDSGQEYNSNTEIRSEWLRCGRIGSFTVDTDYQWSFICRDSSGSFIYISEAYNYKTSGTKINLSAYPNVSDIRIELHDTNGINPPATCTLVIEFVWTIGANGKPTNEYISDLPENPLTQPYPKTMWRIVDGKPTHEYITGISDLPENPLTQPYPKTMWRIDKSRNNGKPYHEYLPIPELPPPPSKWKFAFSDSKKVLFSVEKDMRFGIEISDYKFSFSVSE